VIDVNPFTESYNKNIHNSVRLTGCMYHNLFDNYFFNNIQKQVNNIINLTTKTTYLTHNTSFNFEDKKIHLGSSLSSAREQNVIFDLTFNPEYYLQTKDTIKQWSEHKLRETISPLFYKCVHDLQKLPPLKDNANDWIFYRCHINYLPYVKYLGLHYDGNPIIVNTKTAKDARILSFTYYLHDSLEGMGGELWSVNGFVFKPKQNSAIIINGNQVLHGVTQNMHPDARLAFTMRIAHKDDLFLPGHPSKWLYDVSSITADLV
jgi:hypothetical protein